MIFYTGGNEEVTAVEIASFLGLDPGYTRLIKKLTPARRLYDKFGFTQVSSEKTVEWGRPMSIEYLELRL